MVVFYQCLQVRSCIEKVQAMGEAAVDDMSDFIINFYQAMQDRMQQHHVYKGNQKHSEHITSSSTHIYYNQKR